ncbi:MAG: four helix bundle protein [Terriglobia bacterium]
MGRSYEDLVVWQKAMKLAMRVDGATRGFPKEEMFGLTGQIRRAAVSVPSNIAEGQGRLSPKDFRNFLGVARGSLQELQTQLRLAEGLGYLKSNETAALLEEAAEVGRALNGLMTSLDRGRAAAPSLATRN